MKGWVILGLAFLAFLKTEAFIGNDIFKTGDSRLLPLFCAETTDDLLAVGRNTFTHESITITGIRRSILQLFAELKPDYQPPADDASLSQLFRLVNSRIFTRNISKRVTYLISRCSLHW
jgi:hypothetical protein